MAFIALHIGAGYHAVSKRDNYLQICTKACEVGMKCLQNNSSNVDAVVEAIKCLEDEVLTNAGFGSNLNSSGYVECDSSVMDGSDLVFGSVGAIQSIKNPIEVANIVLVNQRKSMPLGLIAPNFLAGDGARKLALSHGCKEFALESDKSRSTFNKYKRQLDEYNLHNDISENKIKHRRCDTVGAICVDKQGRVASGVSSGGLILKQEGRIGQASIIGAGCWAQSNVSFTTSGIGEYIVRTSLARECAKKILEDSSNSLESLTKIFNDNFFESPLMKNISRDDHLAGILGLIHDESSKSIELIWLHSTASMCIGYMNSSSKYAKAFVSDMPSSSKPGSTMVAQSRLFKYR